MRSPSDQPAPAEASTADPGVPCKVGPAGPPHTWHSEYVHATVQHHSNLRLSLIARKPATDTLPSAASLRGTTAHQSHHQGVSGFCGMHVGAGGRPLGGPVVTLVGGAAQTGSAQWQHMAPAAGQGSLSRATTGPQKARRPASGCAMQSGPGDSARATMGRLYKGSHAGQNTVATPPCVNKRQTGYLKEHWGSTCRQAAARSCQKGRLWPTCPLQPCLLRPPAARQS